MSKPTVVGGFEFYMIRVYGVKKNERHVETNGFGRTIKEAKESAYTSLYNIHDHYVSDGLVQIWKNVDGSWSKIEEDSE